MGPRRRRVIRFPVERLPSSAWLSKEEMNCTDIYQAARGAWVVDSCFAILAMARVQLWNTLNTPMRHGDC